MRQVACIVTTKAMVLAVLWGELVGDDGADAEEEWDPNFDGVELDGSAPAPASATTGGRT